MARCTTPWLVSVITGTPLHVKVDVNGTPRQVSDVRSIPVPVIENDEECENNKTIQ